MTRPVILRPQAQDDLAGARDWYEQQRPGLGDDFVTAADDLFARLATTPEMHALILRDVRRAKLQRFPYAVNCQVLPDQVEVVAVQRSRRDRGVWQSRV